MSLKDENGENVNSFVLNAQTQSFTEKKKMNDPKSNESKKKTRRKTKRKRGNSKTFLKWKQRQIDPNTFISDEAMTSLNIPPFLQHVYLSGIPETPIKSFREWQTKLFSSDEWKEGKNTIILVPTSGGKTVAADVAIAQLLANDKKAKAILAVPFVALANEKYNEYVQRFFPYTVRPFYMNVGGNDFHRGQVAVCTYEKAHSILTSALIGGYANQIKLVVVDEVHMIGDEFRGPVIEALIEKLLLMKHNPRIIGMTATINENDANRLAKWINGFPFISESRPSHVKQFVSKNDGSLYRISNESSLIRFHLLKKVDGDPHFIIDPIRTLLSRSSQSAIIIFVNTRAETLSLAVSIANKMYDQSIDLPKIPQPSPELLAGRKKLLQDLTKVTGVLDKNISKCIYNGIGIHHAGLLLEERKLYEAALRNRVISVLVATTTLSAGINIHNVSRVFIMNIYRRTSQNEYTPIPPAQFTQMVGRAGRAANFPGDAFIIANRNNEREIQDIINLSKHKLSDLHSYLLKDDQLDRFFLQCLSTGLVSPNHGLVDFINMALDGKDTKPEDAAKRLIEMQLIDKETFEATKLGKAIAGSGLSVEEGTFLSEIISQMQKCLCLDDELHLLYLCVPPSIVSTIKKEPYDSSVWISIFTNHLHVLKLITQLKSEEIERIQDLPKIYGGNGHISPEIDLKLDRIYTAAILLELINENPVSVIMKKFGIDRGTIQSLQMQSASFAGQASKFCELYGSVLLSATLNRFRQRLNFAARSELLALMVLPSVNKSIARVLFDSGIASPIELAGLSIGAIAAIISPIDENGVKIAPGEREYKVSESIFAEASEYANSLERMEVLEELAMQNFAEL